jgi:ATP-dependent Lon protease
MSLQEKIHEHFAGLVVRKDLSKLVRGNALVPTYVLEYLLGQYCATDDQDSIESGIETVKNILASHYVNRNEAELIKSHIREKGRYKIIDKIVVQLNDKNDTYEASFGNLGIKKVIVDREHVKDHPKLLVGGVWCILDIEYMHEDDKQHIPWIIDTLKPIQISHVDLESFKELRKNFTVEEWIDVLIQSLGFNPDELGERNKLFQLVRIISYCENNYNLIELGPKGTGKSHVFSEFSPHGILVSGGEVTLAKLFVNNSNGRLGLVGYWDVVAFDEFAGKGKKADKSLVDVMKNYMANHSFSRGTDQITADASMVFVGNTSKSVSYLLKQANLFDDLPAHYQDSAFLDRIHFYIPGWEVNIIRNEMFTTEFGFIVDYLAQVLKLMRFQDYTDLYRQYFELDNSLSTRDKEGINKTFSGLMKIMYPHREATKEEIKDVLHFAVEGRKRVKSEIYKLDHTFDPVYFRYKDIETAETVEVLTPEERRYPHYFKHFDEESAFHSSEPSEKGTEAQTEGSTVTTPQTSSLSSQTLPDREHISIEENQSGISYHRLFAPYLQGAKYIELQDPYIRKHYQIQNLIDFIQVIIATKEEGEDTAFHLITASGEIKLSEIEPPLRELQDELLSLDVRFTFEFNETIHDRLIKVDKNWLITLGRGLDMFQPFSRSGFSLERASQEARLCKSFEITYMRLKT